MVGRLSVLFVDDEPRVLEALERAAFDLDLDWELVFESDARAALDALRARCFDALVTDLRMPGLDGATLLERSAALCPNLVRVVLSGQADRETGLRVWRQAHQFLPKPSPLERIVAVVERACELRDRLADPRLRGLLTRRGDLPRAPRLLAELGAVLDSEDASVAQVASVAERDPALVAKLLQLANSPFFGGHQPLHEVQRAIGRLGLGAVRAVALGVGATSTLASGAAADQVDRHQRHAVATATLARRCSGTRPDRDVVFSAAMLADIGRLALVDERAAELAGVSLRPSAEHAGLTHADAAAYLLSLWGLPPLLVDTVANRYRPRRSVDPGGPVLFVHAATALLEGESLDLRLLEEHGLGSHLSTWYEWSEEHRP